MSRSNYCLVIPHYNHLKAFTAFVPKLESIGLPCIVVDDGSQPEQQAGLRELLRNRKDFEIITHLENQGKGGAMITGALSAGERGFTHILQIDADGQHDVSDADQFIQYSQDNPDAILSGAPLFASDAPKARLYGRKVTDFWVALETLSLSFKDSLCGFRIYPVKHFENVLSKFTVGKRMDFDTEILVKSVWLGVKVHFIPTKVQYIKNNVSHFNYLEDNLSLIYLHIRLMLGMLVRLPKLLYWRLSGHSATQH